MYTVRNCVFTARRYADEWPLKGKLKDVALWFSEVLDKIPAEYRDEAEVEFENGYEESSELTVFYNRPETDSERAARLKDQKRYQAHEERQEMLEWQRLNAKFAGKFPDRS